MENGNSHHQNRDVYEGIIRTGAQVIQDPELVNYFLVVFICCSSNVLMEFMLKMQTRKWRIFRSTLFRSALHISGVIGVIGVNSVNRASTTRKQSSAIKHLEINFVWSLARYGL